MEQTGRHSHVLVVGSGFAGLGMAIRLRQRGFDDFSVIERADDLGGVWRDNTYPGCASDTSSLLYSYSFAPNPRWSRTFAPGPEILTYLRRCARLFGVDGHLRFGVALLSAAWDDDRTRWRITTSAGQETADVLIMATGPFSDPVTPMLTGLDRFAGPAFHSARWDHDCDLTGRTVALVGTSSTAAQLAPRLQPLVAELHVYQRTPQWIVPLPDRPISERKQRVYAALPITHRLVRGVVRTARELLVPTFRHPALAAALSQRVASEHVRRSVPDPELRAKLVPPYPMGCKRIVLSSDYLTTMTKPNVELITTGISEVRERSIVTADGTERPADVIVFATGFRVTDPAYSRHVRGRDGVTLAESWQGSPKAFLGTTVGRLSQPVPAGRAEHRAGPQLGPAHVGSPARLRDDGADGDAPARLRRTGTSG